MTLYKKKICFVTSSRAEYGMIKNLLFQIKKSKKLNLKILATGTHLSARHGLTYKEILQDDLQIYKKLKISINSDTSLAISRAISEGVKKFSKEFNSLRPDLILILGDRFEIFSAAIAAMSERIPIAHIHGGELTEGAIDDAMRHSITKMSHLHFVAAKEYKNRVHQLGESKKFIYLVGGMGADIIKNMKFINKNELQKKLKFIFRKKNIFVNFHPVTLEKNSSRKHIKEILKALKLLKKVGIIFSMPNADHNSKIIYDEINSFVKKNKNSIAFKSLGSLKYLSCLKLCNVVLGNSSSGLLEAPNLKIPTINIGDRQKGRAKSGSVVDCLPTQKKIYLNLTSILSGKKKFKNKDFFSPYGQGGASKKILKILEKVNYKNLLKKKFINIVRT